MGIGQAKGLILQLRGEASDIRKSRVPPVNASVKKGFQRLETFSSREASLIGSVLRAIVTRVAEVCLNLQTGNGEKPVFRMRVLTGCVIQTHTHTHTHTHTYTKRNSCVKEVMPMLFLKNLYFLKIYLFIHERHREREAET